jgi:uncharacterized protein YjbJ (UPF0337 family)
MGAFDEVKGKVKLAVGDLTDDGALRAEGEAQRDKGAEERKETEARATAKAHEAKAEIAERKQQAAEA